jgi:hypothetical protein
MKSKGFAILKTVLVVLLMVARVSAANWPTAHGASDNTGLAKVVTNPAKTPTGFADVGRVAPGANPVTGPDGTVYVGNLAGEVIALHPDGKPFWKRTLNSPQGIFASPAVGSDGSVYVVSTMSIRDHRGGQTTYIRGVFLNKFTSSGGLLFSIPFPKTALYPFTDGGVSAAPPNIWHYNGTEVIMVPAIYTGAGKNEVRVIAFSTGGAVIGDKRVTLQEGEITGGCDCLLQTIIDYISECFITNPVCTYTSTDVVMPFREGGWAQPGVAIWEYPGYSPYVWVADNIRSTVAYKFDPTTGFSEIYRFSDKKDRLSSPPTALDNVMAAVGTSDGVLKFERDSNFTVSGWGAITAATTRMADGRLAVIGRYGTLFLMSGHSVSFQQTLNGYSVASAAASCTHLFVSSTEELVTFDVRTMSVVARVPWTDGGRHAPVIGPQGHVYAMTNFGLFVFAPPSAAELQAIPPIQAGCTTIAVNPIGPLTPR